MRHKWSKEEIAFLRRNIKKYSYKQLTNVFNREYNLNLSFSAVEHACLRNNISHGRKGEKGFIKGEHNEYSQTLPIGSERIDERGRVWVKIKNDVYPASSSKHIKNWKQKNRLVYEERFGEVKRNEFIIHLDSNKQNCRLENLYKVSQSVNMQMNQNRWYSENPCITLTAIKYCELLEAKKKQIFFNDNN